MKIFLLTLSLCATHSFVKAQKLEKRLLDERVKKIDTANKFREEGTLYVINGIPFTEADSTKLDSTLQSFNLKLLVSLDFLTCAASNIIPCNKTVVLVTFAYNQKIKKKRPLWKKVRHAFNDSYVSFSQHIFNDAKDPVLYIDNELIHHTEARKRVKALSLKTIYYIDYTDKPVPLEHYGQNAKNGLIRIWTVPK